jgi:hypothetical protein
MYILRKQGNVSDTYLSLGFTSLSEVELALNNNLLKVKVNITDNTW